MKPKFHIYSSFIICCISMLLFTANGIQAVCVAKSATLMLNDTIVGNDTIISRTPEDSIEIRNLEKEIDDKLMKLEAPVDTAMLSSKSDSVMNAPQTPSKRWIPDSNKSLWMAMVLPGAGQIYNKKYWKLPIIYGGFVGCAYALTWNTKMYNDYSQAYQDIMSDNPNNDSYKDLIPSYVNIESNLEYYQKTFKNAKDIYRRQRDLSIFAFIGVYLLSVIDAYVDAELSDFDISRDLSLKLEPTLFNDAFRNCPQGVGLQCNIKF